MTTTRKLCFPQFLKRRLTKYEGERKGSISAIGDWKRTGESANPFSMILNAMATDLVSQPLCLFEKPGPPSLWLNLMVQ